jgi:hypothetical protein
VLNGPRTHSLLWYMPLLINIVDCNSVLIEECAGAGGD